MLVSPFYLLGMYVRRVPIRKVLAAIRRARGAGLQVPLNRLESHALAGGDPDRVIRAVIEARHQGLTLSWGLLWAADLGGEEPLVALTRAHQEPNQTVVLDLLRERAKRDTEAAVILAQRLAELYRTAPATIAAAFGDPRVAAVMGMGPTDRIRQVRAELALEVRALVARLPADRRGDVLPLETDA